MSRYKQRVIAINENLQYLNLFDERGVTSIEQYKTIEKEVFEQEVYDSIPVIKYAWKFGDMYWRLSDRIYGDPQYWWVIASFNKRPTESHNKVGDILRIPIELSDALQVVD